MRTVVADLHMHTHYSDGTLSPADLVREMAEGGIEVLSVTDHDTIAGLEEARAAAEEHGVECVPGVELTVTVGDDVIHLLGYGFDASDASLRSYLSAFADQRRERMERMVEMLRKDGVDISMEDVLAGVNPSASLGRPHLAEALVRGGIVSTQEDAFREYIGNGQVAYVPAPGRPAEEGIDRVHQAGGFVSVAHPGQWMSSATLRRLLRMGVDAIECRCPSHAPYLVDYYRKRCETAGLLVTGGSDFHTRDRHEERVGDVGLSAGEWVALQARA